MSETRTKGKGLPPPTPNTDAGLTAHSTSRLRHGVPGHEPREKHRDARTISQGEKLRHGGGPAGEGGAGGRFQRLRQASKATPGKYKMFPRHGSSGSFCPTFKNWVGNSPFIHQGAFCSFQPGANVGLKDGMTKVPTADGGPEGCAGKGCTHPRWQVWWGGVPRIVPRCGDRGVLRTKDQEGHRTMRPFSPRAFTVWPQHARCCSWCWGTSDERNITRCCS